VISIDPDRGGRLKKEKERQRPMFAVEKRTAVEPRRRRRQRKRKKERNLGNSVDPYNIKKKGRDEPL